MINSHSDKVRTQALSSTPLEYVIRDELVEAAAAHRMSALHSELILLLLLDIVIHVAHWKSNSPPPIFLHGTVFTDRAILEQLRCAEISIAMADRKSELTEDGNKVQNISKLQNRSTKHFFLSPAMHWL